MTEVNEQTYEGTFAVGTRADLTLRNVRGSIEVSGWDRPEVHVVAVKKLGTEWGARESFERTAVEMDQSGSHVRVRTRSHGDRGIFGWIGIGRTPPQVAYTVKVPATSDVSVRTVAGLLTVSDVLGTLYLRTVDGEINITRVSGQILLSGVSAQIRGDQIGGAVAIKTVSGHAVLAKSQLTSFLGKCVSGDVRIETTLDTTGTYESRTVDGSLHLIVPPDSRATGELESVSGRASCELPCQVSEERRGRVRWRGIINGGGATISLKTVSGDLMISAASDLAQAPVAAPSASSTASDGR